VQLITISAIVKSKCTIEKGNVCTKMCRDSVKMMMFVQITRFRAVVNPA